MSHSPGGLNWEETKRIIFVVAFIYTFYIYTVKLYRTVINNVFLCFRVIYLLSCCPLEESVSYLLNHALSDDTSISATHRLRALHCLLAIANEKVIEKHYVEGISSIR